MERREPPGQGRLQGVGGLRAPDARRRGDWRLQPEFYAQNPPPDMLETSALNEAMFNLYLARQLPQSGSCRRPRNKAGSSGAFRRRADGDQRRQMPTALDIAQRVKMVRPDSCTITLAKGQAPSSPPASTAPARGDRDRLAEAGRAAKRAVAGEGGRPDQGDGRLDTRRRRLARARPAVRIDWTSSGRHHRR